MPKLKSNIVSKMEFAKLLELSRPRITQLCNAGLPVRKDGRIDAKEALAWYRKHIRVATSRLMKPSGAPTGNPADDQNRSDYIAARARREELLVKRAELELRRLDGELIDAKEVEQEVFKIFRAERDALQDWPSRVSAIIAGELAVSPDQMEIILSREIRTFLIERSREERFPDDEETATPDEPALAARD